ncbi:MAG: hypothetical protein ACR2OX_12265 [Methyloligellaceae bacterium]
MPLQKADAVGANGRDRPVLPKWGVRSWTCPAPRIDTTRILRVHKYTDPGKVRPVIREAAAVAVESAARLSLPDARYVVTPIKSLEDGVLTLDNGLQFNCPAFDDHLRGCTVLLAFVITIGPDLDDTVISLVHDTFEPLDALFLETAGWLTIEAATRQLVQNIKTELGATGWRLSLRLGPGYNYPSSDGNARVVWDLTEQRTLFSLFDGQDLPIELMESGAMKPKMSRSGAFGMGPAQP